MRAGLSDQCDRLRQPERSGEPRWQREPGPAAQTGSAQLCAAHRGEHPAPHFLSGEAAEPEPGFAAGIATDVRPVAADIAWSELRRGDGEEITKGCPIP